MTYLLRSRALTYEEGCAWGGVGAKLIPSIPLGTTSVEPINSSSVGNQSSNPVTRSLIIPGRICAVQREEVELYDLAADPRETTNVADANADVVVRLKKIMQEQHLPSTTFPLRAID